jgi:hypothetical protein
VLGELGDDEQSTAAFVEGAGMAEVRRGGTGV